MGEIETDYLVIGAGASAMAFTDELIATCDADVVVVDRREAPGGHWNDAYPFVRLHQAAANYGVNSLTLGTEDIASAGPDAGFYERATGAEISAYFRRVMDHQLIPSGRVRYLPMSDYLGNWADEHPVRSRLTGARVDIKVRRRVVDTTYLDVKVPATHTPSFTVDPRARVIPVGRLTEVTDPPSGFTVFGAGKTAMDACTWLLRQGVDPARIRWVRPRDVWIMDLASLQPLDLIARTLEGMATWTECLANAGSLPELFADLDASGELMRLDPQVTPEVFRGPIMSRAEAERLRGIERVVRLGRVRHVGADRISLEDGEIRTDPRHIHVDCTASGFRWAPPRPIFEPGRITVQSLIGGYTTQYAAFIGYVEAAREDDAERNRLCPPVPQITTPIDWVAMMAGFLRTAAMHGAEADLAQWTDTRRLSFSRGLSARRTEPQVAAALERWADHTDTALKNADSLLSAAGRK